MKIAVATIDGVSISQHFGRSAGFIVFEVEDKLIKSRELRTNNHTPHAQGLCHGEHHEHGTHTHGHDGVVGLLHDCSVVLCGGMGAGAAQALAQQGIQSFVLPSPCPADEAVTQYLHGALPAVSSAFCGCQH